MPIPKLVCWALFGLLSAFSLVCEAAYADQWEGFALGCLLMFWGLLRPGEFWQLTFREITFPRTSRGIERMIITIREAKNMRSMGRLQTSIINNRVAIRWAARAAKRHLLSDPVMPGGRQKFTRLLQWSLELLGIPKNTFTCAGFRAGGATAYFVQGMELARLRVLGRWRNLLTLDHYIQEASAAVSEHKLGEQKLRELQAFVSAAGFLRRPPS